MNEIQREVKENEEIIIRHKLLETIREIYTLLNDKEYSSNNRFDKNRIIKEILILLKKERTMTIDSLARKTGVLISYVHSANNNQFKEKEMIIHSKDNSIISTIGFYIECFIERYDNHSLKYDCEVIKGNNKIVKEIKKKVYISNIEEFKEPYLKNYILLIIEQLIYPASADIIMSSHSFFTGYLQGIVVINGISSEEEEKSHSRLIFSKIYDDFDLNNL